MPNIRAFDVGEPEDVTDPERHFPCRVLPIASSCKSTRHVLSIENAART